MKTLPKTKRNILLIWGISFFVLGICLKFIGSESLIFLQGFFLALSLVFYGAGFYKTAKQKRKHTNIINKRLD